MATADVLAAVIEGLSAEAPHPLSPLEMAELLWLARLPLKRAEQPDTPAEVRPAKALAPEPTVPQDTPQNLRKQPPPVQPAPPSEDRPLPFFPPAPERDRPAPEARLLPAELLPGARDIPRLLPLRLAEAPLFNDSFSVLRVFQPLMARVPSPHRVWLDETATVDNYAETRILSAVQKPDLEPCFRVLVLLDAGVSMEVWRPLAEELRAILASSQAFRAVDLRRVDPSRGELETEGWTPQASVVLLLSDAAGPHWWDGRMFTHLEQWGRLAPVALLNMLPPNWWGRTALGIAPLVSLSNTQPGSANLRYRPQPLNRWQSLDPFGDMALPVLTLEAQELAIWAAMAMGDGDVAISGILIPEDKVEKGATTSTDDGAVEGAGEGSKAGERSKRLETFLLPPEEATPEEAAPADPVEARKAASRRWKEFREDASAQAQRLMMVMAAAPVLTLPIIRLLLEAKVKEATNPLPMAEVLVSGLLRCRPSSDPPSSPQRLQLELEPGVANLLRERLSPGDTLDVIRAVTAVIERRWNAIGNGHSFEAILTDPTLPLPEGMDGVLHFATVTADLLEQLPGNAYRAFAAKLRQRARIETADPFPAELFRFEPIDVPCARLVRTPELLDSWFSTARIADLPSHRFDVETAWIDPGPMEVRRKEASRGGFQEWLLAPSAPDARDTSAPLAMLHIPAGRFLMGSPLGEAGRDDDEGPQHEVRLREFFLARTPITQAQWRAVAQWERKEWEEEALWPAELNPDPVAGLREPERFRGNDKPVVNVSWNEAMAFCRRLQLRTGKNYTLPSEAQWEYACRAGTTTPFAFGETLSSELANYNATVTYGNGPKGEYRQQTTPVDMFPANAWGLQDMHGNVWEWCLDHWHASYKGAPEDGSAWLEEKADEDKGRLLRGGSWFYRPQDCRSAFRVGYGPAFRLDNGGFRVCCLPQDLLLIS